MMRGRAKRARPLRFCLIAFYALKTGVQELGELRFLAPVAFLGTHQAGAPSRKEMA